MAFHNVPPNGFPDLPDVEELEAVVKDVTTLKTTTAEQGAAITNLGSTKANQITIAPFFNPETAYEAGDLVYYNGLSYRCTNDHEGAWDAADFAATTIAGEIASVKSGLTNLGIIVPLVHEEMPNAATWESIQGVSIDVNAYRYFGLRLSTASSPVTGTPLNIFSKSEFLDSNAANPLAVLFNTVETGDSYNVYVQYAVDLANPLIYYRGSNVSDTLYLTIVGIK